MKGFLVTQRISVTSFVNCARALVAEGHFDSNEIEEILGDIEERWVDINTRVNDCEQWLCEMNTKQKSCRDTINAISYFLDETEKILGSFSSFDGDLDHLCAQKKKIFVSTKYSCLHHHEPIYSKHIGTFICVKAVKAFFPVTAIHESKYSMTGG